eukprot:c887_g1_i2.p1 GENE.c887_g1_i2~~c887_g1_i2.p1  ORF type:complete len:287 (+),score=75.64 c887_g1_i2:54-863(+)
MRLRKGQTPAIATTTTTKPPTTKAVKDPKATAPKSSIIAKPPTTPANDMPHPVPAKSKKSPSTRAKPNFVCSICSKEFLANASLVGHFHAAHKLRKGHKRKLSSPAPAITSSQSSEVFECLQCGKTFPTTRSLQGHRAAAHLPRAAALEYKQHDLIANKQKSQDEPIYSCVDCDKKFTNLLSLSGHRGQHIRWRNFKLAQRKLKQSNKASSANSNTDTNTVEEGQRSENHIDAIESQLPAAAQTSTTNPKRKKTRTSLDAFLMDDDNLA